MHLPLQKIHDRKDATSTKLANNTYGRVAWQDDFVDPDVYEAVIRYHDTDIIRCFYSVGPGDDTTAAIQPLSVFIDTGGWNTPTTTRRINQFCRDNNILATMHSVRDEVFWMEDRHFFQAIQDWEDGLFQNIAEAKRHYNEFDNELYTGGLLL